MILERGAGQLGRGPTGVDPGLSGAWVRTTPGSTGPGVVRLVWGDDAQGVLGPPGTFAGVAAVLRTSTDPCASVSGAAESWGCSIDARAGIGGIELDVTGDPRVLLDCLGEVRARLRRISATRSGAAAGREAARKVALIREQNPVERAVDELVAAHLASTGSLQWPPGGSAAAIGELRDDALVAAVEAVGQRDPDAVLAAWPRASDVRTDPSPSTPPVTARLFAAASTPRLAEAPGDRELAHDGAQSALVWGAVISAHSPATWWALEVVLEHLTGGLTSPWNSHLREERGDTYGVGSKIEVHTRGEQHFLVPVIVTALRPEALAYARDWTRAQLDRLARTGLTHEQTAEACNRLLDRRRLARLSSRGTLQTLALAHAWGAATLDADRDAWLGDLGELPPGRVAELVCKFTHVALVASPDRQRSGGTR